MSDREFDELALTEHGIDRHVLEKACDETPDPVWDESSNYTANIWPRQYNLSGRRIRHV